MRPKDATKSAKTVRGALCDARLSLGAAAALLVGLAAAWAAPAGGRAQAAASAEGPEVEAVRSTLEKWMETQRLISKEKQDWRQDRVMLESRIELLEREIDNVEEKIASTEKEIGETSEKRDELRADNERLKEAVSVLRARVADMEKRTKALLEQLPETYRAKVETLAARLPDQPKNTDLSLSKRFQNVIGVLNELNKANSQVTVESEVRDLPDGRSREVRVLYLGLGHAYYVGGDGSIAGYGTAGADGWRWKTANAAAPAISEAIAIVENEKVARFVQLPLEVR